MDKLRFYAVNPSVDRLMPAPFERDGIGAGEMVSWGDGNSYPLYLEDLYRNVATLRSCIDGSALFTVGNEVAVTGFSLAHDCTVHDFVYNTAFSYWLFGGFAWQVDVSAAGMLVRNIDLRFLRCDRERKIFFYSERFGRRHLRIRRDTLQKYPSFTGRPEAGTSILACYGGNLSVYPQPVYGSAVMACETEREISRYHLAAIHNGFAGSYIVNLNNGIPASDDVKDEIERMFYEKFTGASNAARVLFSWNESKETETTLQRLEVDDFGEQYKTLAERSRQQIFTAFRAHPNLFGIPTDGTGFSGEEYEQVFRLYNRTQIRPVQDMITLAAGRLGGMIEIQPFSIDDVTEATVR